MRQIDHLRSSPAFASVAEEARDLVMQQTVANGPGPARLEMPSAQVQGFEAASVGRSLLGATSSSTPVPRYLGPQAEIEAIILERLRPPYLIRDDEIEIVGEFDAVELVISNKQLLERTAKSVGRIDLWHHATHDFVGTGWLIEDDLVVTNRHVADAFAATDRMGGYDFRMGTDSTPIEAQVDFVRQHRTSGIHRKVFVTAIAYIAGPREPDFAFLRIKNDIDAVPLPLRSRLAESGTAVAAIGYPAWDGGRNDPTWMDNLFGGIYNVKRFSPGFITGSGDAGILLEGDYTSLGGSSGSAVCRLEDGEVVGLHFAGVFRQTNTMVAADVIDRARRQLRTLVKVDADLPTEAKPAPAEFFRDRSGYDPDFLGEGPLSVPLPDLREWIEDVAPASDAADHVLRYEHFSVVQCASRRLPLFTAVNIDGGKQRKLSRKGEWKLDGRIDVAHQVGYELYAGNDMDRGHMVRRRDPGWGDAAMAVRAELDTFFYTNSVPQHKDLNRKDWVCLEDYVLEAAETLGFKASVFTGPVFRSTDKHLRNSAAATVAIPEEFWKIVVMKNARTDRLHATAYVLSHGPLIRDMTEAPFLYGRHKTFQVPLALVESATRLSFGGLRSADPLGKDGRETFPVIEINGPDDLVLS